MQFYGHITQGLMLCNLEFSFKAFIILFNIVLTGSIFFNECLVMFVICNS